MGAKGEKGRIMLLMNKSEFQPKKYGEASIKKSAQFYEKDVDFDTSTYNFNHIGINEVEDETALFNLG